MTNKAIEDWRAFRRYVTRGYDIREELEEEEKPDEKNADGDGNKAEGDDETAKKEKKEPKLKRICFTYWQPSTKGLGMRLALMPIIAFFMVAATLVMTFLLARNTSLSFGSILGSLAVSIVVCCVLPFWLLMKSNNYCSRLTIGPGAVIWDREIARGGGEPPPTTYFSQGALVIPVDEIRSFDVRLGDSIHTPEANINLYRVVVWHGPTPVYTIASDTEEGAMTLKEGVVAAIGVLNPPAPTSAGPPGAGRTVAWE